MVLGPRGGGLSVHRDHPAGPFSYAWFSFFLWRFTLCLVSLRSSLLIFGFGSGLAWGAFFLIFTTVPPEVAGGVGEVFFFLSLAVALTGTFTILGVLGRRRLSTVLPLLHIAPAFRQGVLLAAAAVGFLVLERFQFLRWWNILLLVGVLVAVDAVLARRSENVGVEGMTDLGPPR